MNTVAVPYRYLPPAGGRPLPAASFASERDTGLQRLLEDLARVSEPMRRVWDQAAVATDPDSSAYIMAEIGAGGETFASYIARERHRKGQAVIALDEQRCKEWSTPSGGLRPEIDRTLRYATLFVSDIRDVSCSFQSQLAEKVGRPDAPRFVICHRYQPDAAGSEASHQSALLDVLRRHVIRVPPLRDYAKHLPDVVRYFAVLFSKRFGKRVTRIAPDSLDCLSAHWWPGNLYELRNVIERAVLLATGDELQVRADTFAAVPSARHQPGGFPAVRLRRTLDYVEQHLGDDVVLQDLACQAGMSRFHFCRQFKRSTGVTPHQYILRQRIERAKQILRTEQASLASLSHELGFTSQSHFTTVFRKLVGVTPKTFREMR